MAKEPKTPIDPKWLKDVKDAGQQILANHLNRPGVPEQAAANRKGSKGK